MYQVTVVPQLPLPGRHTQGLAHGEGQARLSAPSRGQASARPPRPPCVLWAPQKGQGGRQTPPLRPDQGRGERASGRPVHGPSPRKCDLFAASLTLSPWGRRPVLFKVLTYLLAGRVFIYRPVGSSTKTPLPCLSGTRWLRWRAAQSVGAGPGRPKGAGRVPSPGVRAEARLQPQLLHGPLRS